MGIANYLKKVVFDNLYINLEQVKYIVKRGEKE